MYVNAMANPVTERCVLGCLLLDDDARREIPKLAQGDFTEQMHRDMLAVIQELYVSRTTPDLATIAPHMAARGYGPLDYVDVTRSVPNVMSFPHYLNQLKEAAQRRAVFVAARTIGQMAQDQSVGNEELVSKSTGLLAGLQAGNVGEEDESLMGAVIQVLGLLEKRMRGEGLGCMTGLSDFDQKTGGIFDSELTVIAGLPATGKSAFAMSIATAMAAQGRPVQVFSREMSRILLTMRMLSDASNVDGKKMRTGDISDDDYAQIADGANRIGRLPIWIDERSGTPSAVFRKCRERKEKGGLGLVVVDYLQLMSGDKKANTKNDEVGAISRAMKELTQELSVPVLLLSQFNRTAQPGVKPTMNMLRDSGSIEADANNILLLWNPVGDEVEPLRSALERHGRRYIRVELAKQRSSDIGHCDLEFDPAHMRFNNLPMDNAALRREMEGA